jgi:hypothetical protein
MTSKPPAKLSADDVRAILRGWRRNGGPYRQRELAVLYGVSQATISLIVKGRRRADVPL